MGKLAVFKYVTMMFLVLQVILTVFTFVALYGGDVNPIGNTARAMLVFILPFLIIGNALMIIYWIIRRKWFLMLLPVITIACCIPFIGTLVQLRFGDDKEAIAQKGLKIATYSSGYSCRDAPTEN